MDAKKILRDANKEFEEEKAKLAKEQVKHILRKIDTAKQVVKNLERELADAYCELGKSGT